MAQQIQIGYMTKPENVAAATSYSEGADVGATAEYLRESMTSDLRPDLSRITVPLLEIAPFDASIDPRNPFSPQPTLDGKRSYYQKLLAGDRKQRSLRSTTHGIS